MLSDNPEKPAVTRRDASTEAFIEIAKASLNLVPLFIAAAKTTRRTKSKEGIEKPKPLARLLPTTLHPVDER